MTWVCDDPDVLALVREARRAADVLWNTGLLADAERLQDAADTVAGDDEEPL